MRGLGQRGTRGSPEKEPIKNDADSSEDQLFLPQKAKEQLKGEQGERGPDLQRDENSMMILRSDFFVLFEQFEHLGDKGEEVVLIEISLIRRIEPLHDLLHLFLRRLLNVHLLGSEGQDLLELVPLNAAVVVDVDHIEGSLVYAAQLLLVLYQFFPHSMFKLQKQVSLINGMLRPIAAMPVTAAPRPVLPRFPIITISGRLNCPIRSCLSCPIGFKLHSGRCLSFPP